MGSFCTDNY